MSQLGLFAYCAVMGFAAAGTVASFYQWVTAERADFAINAPTIKQLAVVVIISTLGGPFIVAQKVISGWRTNELKMLPAAVGVLVACMWSGCAGIFYLSLILRV